MLTAETSVCFIVVKWTTKTIRAGLGVRVRVETGVRDHIHVLVEGECASSYCPSGESVAENQWLVLATAKIVVHISLKAWRLLRDGGLVNREAGSVFHVSMMLNGNVR